MPLCYFALGDIYVSFGDIVKDYQMPVDGSTISEPNTDSCALYSPTI